MKMTRDDMFPPIHITIENQQELLSMEAAISDYVAELEDEFDGDIDTPDHQNMKKLQEFLEKYIVSIPRDEAKKYKI